MRWYWIDRYTKFVRGKCATAIKNITLSEEHLHDHFLYYPIMPAPLIVEGVAQAGGLLICEYREFREKVVLAKLNKAIFHFDVRPGDTLIYHVNVDFYNSQGAQISATSHANGKLHAEFQMMFAYVTGEYTEREFYKLSDYRHLLHNFDAYSIGTDEEGNPIEEPECLKNATHF
ncbi:MAG: 3-hydroxyacyl-ACP dehydratase FabZ family protein [Planctomycetia bacterium]|nr:3-hydroxyacyl-ACP dehydratase FabZ family protein [Planctomycetia bacterium]